MTTTSVGGVKVCPSVLEAGRQAAHAVAACLRDAVAAKGLARVIFASAPSQEVMLEELRRQSVPWAAIHAFHMDEYVGLDADHPQAFGKWLADRLPTGLRSFSRITPGHDPSKEIERYARQLSEPVDLVCLGIGVNGHIAFNEPGSSFTEPRLMRQIELSSASRRQQVDDGCFGHVDEVPTSALTLTIPALMASSKWICTVVGTRKAEAVRRCLNEPISESCPGSIIQARSEALMFLDGDAASALGG